MGFSLSYGKRFVKRYAKLSATEQKQVDTKIITLAADPTHPSLRTKRIQGANGLFEMSVNMDIRIVWRYDGNKLILLLDVGHHSVLERY
jgi:mRNA-degrading endonuclease YafQ of YafQ-DinJ toxin-antitoxin module